MCPGVVLSKFFLIQTSEMYIYIYIYLVSDGGPISRPVLQCLAVKPGVILHYYSGDLWFSRWS
jgi:hypothetical protein